MAREHPESDLVPYLRGDLAPAECLRVARHLEECPGCRGDVAVLRELLAELRAALPEPPPVHWARWQAELREKLAARRGPRAWWARPVPLALSASLAGAVLVVAVLAGLPGGRGRGEAPTVDELLLAGRLDMVRQLAVVERLDLLEDFEVIRQLDALGDARKG
jgi:anti-sigma factor RsiW